MEKYMIIPGLDNFAISNKGNLKNIRNGRILKQTINSRGYYQCNVSQDGAKKSLRIHRLVGLLFVSNPENKPYINHIDGDKLNNDTSNLEWVTAKENDSHARKNGLKKGNRPIKSSSIYSGEEFVFYSIGEASSVLGINKGSIHKVLSGKYRQTKGFRFEYLENEKEYNVEYTDYSSL